MTSNIIRRINVYCSIGTLYHYTDFTNFAQILETNKIRLSSAHKVEDSDKVHGSDEDFFLSVTRSKIGGYHKRSVGNYGMLLELNADYFKSRFKVKPVDYWGPEARKIQPNMNEMEERIFSNKQIIPLPSPISKAIRSAHLLLKKDTKFDDRYSGKLRRMFINAKKQGIKIYIYDQEKYWLAMRPQFSVPISSIKHLITGPEYKPWGGARRKSWLVPYYELYMKPLGKPLSERAARLAKNMRNWSYSDDALRSFKADLHNEQKSEYLPKILPLLKKHGGAKGFIEFLFEKYNR